MAAQPGRAPLLAGRRGGSRCTDARSGEALIQVDEFRSDQLTYGVETTTPALSLPRLRSRLAVRQQTGHRQAIGHRTNQFIQNSAGYSHLLEVPMQHRLHLRNHFI